jgi:transposase
MQRHRFTRAQVREIKRYISKENKRKIKDVKAYNRLLVLHMRTLGKQNKEISEIVGFSLQYITELVSKYINEGMGAILLDKRTGNNRNMSVSEEIDFLEQFTELADAGQLITIKLIMEKYVEITGKPCSDTTIYRLLKRHGWRKITPRPAHPGKASEEEIESSKKLTKITASYWQKCKEAGETNLSVIKM